LLIVDDDVDYLPSMAGVLGKEFEVLTADCAESAQGILASRPIDIVLTDQKMPRVTGVQLLEWVRHHSPRSVRLLMTGSAEHEDAVEAINRGQVYYYLLKPWRMEELYPILRNATEKIQLERRQETLLQELREHKDMLAQRTRLLEETNQFLEQRTRELEVLAETDPLTGLLNRRAIENAARLEIRRRARYRGQLALGVLDLDYFKRINDRYMLTGGDFVLVSLARVLRGALRTADSIGRIGGEEFLIVAPETTLRGATRLAERLRSTVENTAIDYEGTQIRGLTISLGFAVAEPGSEPDFDRMRHLAASGVHLAKKNGRNQAVVKSILAPSTASPQPA
jgi:diguanylate cyclase (GGDEF)-like protein